MSSSDYAETYRWLTPDTMLQCRDPEPYLRLYAEDWRSVLSMYGDDQLTIIYDWLFRRLQHLAWGQYIVIEKDAMTLTENLWLKGRYVQWNVAVPDRLSRFRRVVYLMIEWIWRKNDVAHWQMCVVDNETRLLIAEPEHDTVRQLYAYFGHWPLVQPPAPWR